MDLKTSVGQLRTNLLILQRSNLKVKDKQWPGLQTDAIRTKVKWEIIKITISQSTKRASVYGKLNEQLSSKRWPLSYLSLAKYHLETQKVKTVQKLTQKQANTDNQIRSTTLEWSVIPLGA